MGLAWGEPHFGDLEDIQEIDGIIIAHIAGGQLGRLEAGDVCIAGAAVVCLEGVVCYGQIRRVGVSAEDKIARAAAGQVSYSIIAGAAEVRRVSQLG